jgi:hypothetical protein
MKAPINKIHKVTLTKLVKGTKWGVIQGGMWLPNIKCKAGECSKLNKEKEVGVCH